MSPIHQAIDDFLNTVTAQEIFDKAADHLLAQGRPYLGPIHAILPDVVCKELKCFYDYKLAPNPHFALLESLQLLHDHEDPTGWPAGLVEIAEVYNLVISFGTANETTSEVTESEITETV